MSPPTVRHAGCSALTCAVFKTRQLCCHAVCDTCPDALQVKVLAADGSQTQVDVSLGSVSLSTISLTATYRYYLASSIPTTAEYHVIPALPQAPAHPGSPQGRQLLQQVVSLQAAAAQVGCSCWRV